MPCGARSIRTSARGRRRTWRTRRPAARRRRSRSRPPPTGTKGRRCRSRRRRCGCPRNASATCAGTSTFIAQVSAGSPLAPNFRPAMKTTFGTSGSARPAARSSRSQAMVSTPCASSFSLQAGLAEAGDADDALAGRGALGHAGQRRPHLAADAENEDVAIDRGEIVDQGLRRRGHKIFQRVDARESVRQALRREEARRMPRRLPAIGLSVRPGFVQHRPFPPPAAISASAIKFGPPIAPVGGDAEPAVEIIIGDVELRDRDAFTCPQRRQDFAGGRGDAGVTDAVELDARSCDLVADAITPSRRRCRSRGPGWTPAP